MRLGSDSEITGSTGTIARQWEPGSREPSADLERPYFNLHQRRRKTEKLLKETESSTVMSVKRKLNQLRVPLEAEAAGIEADLAPLNDRLLDLDAEMLRLRGELEQLEKERALVSEYRALNLSVISPLRRVPNVLMGKD
ncbi:hypothetical protein C8R46DRAFT_1348085 [Mycena filopes]|nr:hypothetical protein C8R46DRAFT_1348085 [Mycena filopes]